MAEIPPIVWIGIGIVVSFVSMLVPALHLFVAVGILFFVVGIVKMVRASKNSASLQNKHSYHTSNPRNESFSDKNTKVCFVCSAKNSALANFCGHCGHRLT